MLDIKFQGLIHPNINFLVLASTNIFVTTKTFVSILNVGRSGWRSLWEGMQGNKVKESESVAVWWMVMVLVIPMVMVMVPLCWFWWWWWQCSMIECRENDGALERNIHRAAEFGCISKFIKSFQFQNCRYKLKMITMSRKVMSMRILKRL